VASRNAETNRHTYEGIEVAAHYAALNYLSPCERVLFESYIPARSAILELGVGGGRATPYLANRASRYIGVDYAAAMVKTCQTKFPKLEFLMADAANLAAISDASFDVVVFAFNGIDYVLPERSRRSCFAHIHRVLKNGGRLIFSSHNARAVVAIPRWNQERLKRIARRWSMGSGVVHWLLLGILTVLRAAMALILAAGETLMRALKRIPSRMFWRGEGVLIDPVHGGLLTHYSIPRRMIRELDALHFRPERVLGSDYPNRSHPYSTDWYYYVFTKTCEK
jgi:SAM-dependent methyltransferase